jgi:hypothetical protein
VDERRREASDQQLGLLRDLTERDPDHAMAERDEVGVARSVPMSSPK